MAKYKAGLIGCGRIGYKFDLDQKRKGVWTHAGAYHHHDSIDFVGVHDGNKLVMSECAKKYGVKQTTNNNMSEIIEDLDIVSIAVPDNNHQDVLGDLLMFIETGHTKPPKIIWVEKPFTANFETARKFVDTFNDYNCHIHVNYQRRYCEGFERLKKLGTPKNVQITYTRGLYNTASHFVDMVIGLYGEAYKVIPITSTDFIMEFDPLYNDKFRVNFTMLTDIKYNICDSIFYYSDRVIHVPPLQTNFQIQNAIRSEQYSEYYDLQWGDQIELEYDPMLQQVSTFVECIQKNNYRALNNGLSTLNALGKIPHEKGSISL